MNAETVIAGLRAAWQRQHGAMPQVSGVNALSAGAASTSIAFETHLPDGRSEAFVLQLGGAGDASAFSGALGKTQQARVQQSAFAAGIPTPEVVLVLDDSDGLGEGFVSRMVPGESLGGRIVHDARLGAARQQMPQQCAHALAQVHSAATDDFAYLPTLGAAMQCAELARLHRSFGEDLPAFEAAIAWLEENLPECEKHCLVHGDFRTGNFLVGDSGLRSVLDWELAHLGDPHEDIGWLCMRSWRFGADHLAVGGFAERETFYTHYAAAGGIALDAHKVRFWEMLAALKWGVICQSFAWQHLRGASKTLEPALIGRRVSEVELNLVDLLAGEGD